MLRNLYLLRHAKSDWIPTSNDHDRPLNQRGIKEAKKMARYIKTYEISPSLVICSSSQRTQETFKIIKPFINPEPNISIETEIYTFDPSKLLWRISQIPNEILSVMIIGHSPALQQVSLYLTQPNHIRTQLRDSFPTSCLAILDIQDKQWEQIEAQDARLSAFIKPSDLS